MKTWLLVVLAVGCATEPSVDIDVEAHVAPIELVMDERIVLTPGHTVVLPVKIMRDGDHPVQLSLDGKAPPGVTVHLSTKNTKDNVVELEVAAKTTAVAKEIAFTLTAKLGPFRATQPFVVSVQIPSATKAGVEAYAPGVSGHVKTMTVMGETITYEVINGVAVNGDIVLGDAAHIEAMSQLRSATCNPTFHTDFACAEWEDGVIGYSFANDWGDHNAAMTEAIETAMAKWTRHTGIRFVPRTSGQFVQFRNGDGCSSTAGRAVFTGLDSQSVTLNATGCQTAALHEIGHAIGLYHEHNRADRNTYVDIRLSNIVLEKQYNFFRIGDFLVDRGPYNYQSVMHYPRWAFAKDEAACEEDGDDTKCTVLPRFPDLAIDMGQRERITEGDIYGVYRLYPPIYRITSPQTNDTGDRFNLSIDWERGRPAPDIDRIIWTSNRVANPLGLGDRIFIRSDMVPPGANTITASFYVAGQVVTSRSKVLNFVNAAPHVSLATVNGNDQQHMGQLFSVRATIVDAEDGACDGCTLIWTPTPPFGSSLAHTAGFSFDTPGPQTISVIVVDEGGRMATASTTVQIVNTPPVVEIVTPVDGLVVANGALVSFFARATDINGPVPCNQFDWRSSVATDVFSWSQHSCNTPIRMVGAGTRTISVEATDGYETVTASIQVTVTGCTANCPPDVNLNISPQPSSEGYFIGQQIRFFMTFGDVDGSTITIHLLARRVGTTTEIPLQTSSLGLTPTDNFSTNFNWLPIDDVAPWPNCVFDFREYDIVLEVTDTANLTTTITRRIRLGCDLI